MTAKKKRRFFTARWKDHFTFSMRERRGFYLLILLLAAEAGFLYYLRYIHEPGLPDDWIKLMAVSDSLLHSSDRTSNPDSIYYSGGKQRSVRTATSFFSFNPNNLDVDGWRRLGLSEKQARCIIRFREHGMVFKTKNDLLKIKVVDRKRIESWLPFVQLPDSLPKESYVPLKKNLISVDIATADSAQFLQVRGIGPVLAGRIVRYRNRLGGFISLQQIREVYGINDTSWAVLEPCLKLEVPTLERLLLLNSLSEDSLRLHPYVGSKIARQICMFRKQHSFRSVDELRSLPLITDEIYRKIAPYSKAN